jgi:hypothetical protein
MGSMIDLPESTRMADELASVCARQERAAAAKALIEACKLLRCLGDREVADKLEKYAPRVLERAVR